ncbi:MAG: hypothetical protein HUU46_03580 [Candidatus Hydrogenedentes bacterium]|nr:hypothetical protein [Candidatus Hydrogenedentota bacterium]
MNYPQERLVKRSVTYTLHHRGCFYIVENVPARVDVETGEEYFAPETVERLQEAILSGMPPHHTVETPVYQFDEQSMAHAAGSVSS